MALLWEPAGRSPDRCFLDLRGRLLQLRFPRRISPDITHLRSRAFAEVMWAPSKQRTVFATETFPRKARNRRTRRKITIWLSQVAASVGCRRHIFGEQKILMRA